MQSIGSQIDFTKELRLRRWARENYLPTEERDETWHPIVLQEMRVMDSERRREPPTAQGTGFVPLAPKSQTQVVHEPHAAGERQMHKHRQLVEDKSATIG